MNNKEAIIQKIIDDAEKVAQSNIDEAEKTAAQIFDRAKREVEKYKDDNLTKADDLYADALERSKVVSNLDCKKLLLNAKKATIDKAFQEAVDDIMKDKKGYLSLIEKMISSCAEDGDKVVICKDDEKVITKKFVSDLAEKTGKKISLSKDFGDFKGGVILEGKNYDKNLTLELELSAIRQDTEKKISEILFGNK